MFLLTLQSLHFSDMIAALFCMFFSVFFAIYMLRFINYRDSKTSFPKRWIISDLIWEGSLLHPLYLYIVLYQRFMH